MAEKKVILAKSAGFCFGVHRAVDTVYERTDKKNVYTYGPIIHNEEVVKDLESKGVKAISDISDIDTGVDGNATVIIRSHGVSKQIIIIGNEKHPEVEGIMGWSHSPVMVVDSVEKAEELQVDGQKEVIIVSQTTFNYNKFKELVEIIGKKGYNVTIKNTICNATEERQTEARHIAHKVDAMIVIGDKSSSNTRKLYEICKGECENTFYIQTLKDLDLHSLDSVNSIGITAGASTPNNIIEEVYTNVREFCRDVS